MNTTGTGSEGWFILLTIVILVGVGILLAGGPTEFVDQVDTTLTWVAREVVSWVRARV